MKSSEICNRTRCTGCEACANICPQDAITMKADWRGFLYPHIAISVCTDCGLCQKRCPINKKEKVLFEFGMARAYVEQNNTHLLNASSGGAFGVVARDVIAKGGIVFGACMDKEYNVNYIAVETLNDLELLHGSKYTQSYVGKAYREVKDALKAGRWVLFCGCPCQVAGLKRYLHKEYEHLVTMDLICHGVPSQPYFRSYVKNLLAQKKENGITSFRFRYKPNINSEASGAVYNGFQQKDFYMTYFLWGKGYRSGCYHCRFAGEARVGDFTIGDFWNNKVAQLPIDDSQGASLVLFNTEKAKSLESLFLNNGSCLPVKTLSDAISGDGGQLKHPSRNDIRTDLIYCSYKLFGLSGPKMMFAFEKIRFRISK